MNKLQNRPFRINASFLDYLIEHDDELVHSGLLMPEFLLKINFNEVVERLRRLYLQEDTNFHKAVSFSDVMEMLSKNIQRARYERTILEMASAYAGYTFYIPAFLDFRGRIYRSGILHFHERDLARSLILFDEDMPENWDNAKAQKTYMTAAAFHYKRFDSYEAAYDFTQTVFHKYDILKHKFPPGLIPIALSEGAKNPFQYLMFLYGKIKMDYTLLIRLPITQDASASAFQIVSAYMVDEDLAKRTNLISDFTNKADQKIEDIYKYIEIELKSFLDKEDLTPTLKTIKEDYIDRKFVKSIFMPIIYGKTKMSTAKDIRSALKPYIYPVSKESTMLASLCFKFWNEHFKNLENLIRLIRLIGWFASTCEIPVVYENPFFSTSQDYMVMDTHSIWVYDQVKRRKRKVTLRVSSDKRDRKKTQISTFVNKVHQTDASIAMRVTEEMYKFNAPIYTVHDNFLTNTINCSRLPKAYLDVFKDMEPPLKMVNTLIYVNLVQHAKECGKIRDEYKDYRFLEKVHNAETLDLLFADILPVHIQKEKEKLKVWNANVSRFKTYYFGYARTVCCEDPSSGSKDMKWQNHLRRWEQFKSKLNGMYCLHH